MKKTTIAVAVFLFSVSMAYVDGSKDILKKMHDRYADRWYTTLRFNQTTEIYENDSLKRKETWYENIKFPTDFRIDFGNPDSGNAIIFKKDSSYLFKNGKRVGVRRDENDLTFLLGGMYFYPFEEVLSKMSLLGYDLDKFHEDVWKGKGVYVIGAGKGEDSINQLWFDKTNFNLLRMLKFNSKEKEEGLFENHVKLGGGYSESVVYFYINDKLVQVEKYHDIKANRDIDNSIFDALKFVKLPPGSF
ncbi:MAG: hypothetical protein ABJA90_03200 [Ginsengibacter sp.]